MVIENGARDELWLPSVTEMVMLESVPTSLLVGVPVSSPVKVLKLAHDGMFLMENVRVPPLGSETVGVKAYACCSLTVVIGVPEMVGPAVPVVAGGLDALAAALLADGPPPQPPRESAAMAIASVIARRNAGIRLMIFGHSRTSAPCAVRRAPCAPARCDSVSRAAKVCTA